MSTPALAAAPNTRQILSASAFYGVADMLVLAVGGFLLLPLYTRQLSQAEFGAFVIVKTNIDILNCLVHFGLVSAVARVYFDHRKANRHVEYINSVVALFGLILLGTVGLLAIWGQQAWAMLSPSLPALPYLWYCVAISAVGFAGSLGTTWLRMEGRARSFALLQVAAAALLAGAAFVNLELLGLGLHGLLLALLASGLLSAASLPWLLGKHFRPVLRWAQVRQTLHYALPPVASLLAYLVLNRTSTLVLQRHVSMEQVAVFGLAQQLAALVTIAGVAFGKSMQPAIFSADAAHAPALIRSTARLLIAGMLGVTCVVLLFASDIVALVAPASYRDSHAILLILVIAAFVYCLNLISDTTLLYFRRPKSSAAASIAGALASASLSMLLVPQHGLIGAATAIVLAFMTCTLLSHTLAWRLSGQSHFGPMGLALLTACSVAALAAWMHGWSVQAWLILGMKLTFVVALLATLFHMHRRIRLAENPTSP